LELAARPTQSLAFLGKRLRPAAPLEPTRLQRLVAELDDDKFAVRERATQELAGLGDQAGPALTRVLARGPSFEARRRLEGLLKGYARSALPPGLLQQLRALEVLVLIKTPEAGQLIQALAGGSSEARLTREAQAALEMMGGKRN
jgi:hypothetical protein